MINSLKSLAALTPYYEIPLQLGVSWSLKSAPHALIAGSSGSGKTYFSFYLVMMLALKRNLLFVADPKCSDLGALDSYLPKGRVATASDEICSMLEQVVSVMEARYEFMKGKRNEMQFAADFTDYSFPAIVLFIDELASFAALLAKKERDNFDAQIKNLVLKGRQAGVLLCVLLQNPGAQNISTESRSQMGLRVFLGNSSGIELRMLFGEGHAYETGQYGRGEGLYMLAGQTSHPERIQTPRLNNSRIEATFKEALSEQHHIALMPSATQSRSEAKALESDCLGKGETTPPFATL